MNKISKNTNGFSAIEALGVLLVVCLIGGVGLFVYSRLHMIDTWTGDGGSNTNWSDAVNWTRGVPSRNYSLVFNASKKSIDANNNLSNLTLKKITFDGSPANDHTIVIRGNQIGLSNGIIDTTNKKVATDMELTIVLTNNQVFKDEMTGSFNSDETAATNIKLGNYTLTVTAPSASDNINFNSLSGSGGLVLGENTTIDITQSSPRFTGTTVISKTNSSVSVSDTSTGSVIDGLGSGKITIANGGTLYLTSFTSNAVLNNPIDISGNGNGQYLGAIYTVGEGNVEFTGQMTLTGNANIGGFSAYNPGSSGSGTYTFTKSMVTNGYKLTEVGANTRIVTRPM